MGHDRQGRHAQPWDGEKGGEVSLGDESGRVGGRVGLVVTQSPRSQDAGARYERAVMMDKRGYLCNG